MKVKDQVTIAKNAQLTLDTSDNILVSDTKDEFIRSASNRSLIRTPDRPIATVEALKRVTVVQASPEATSEPESATVLQTPRFFLTPDVQRTRDRSSSVASSGSAWSAASSTNSVGSERSIRRVKAIDFSSLRQKMDRFDDSLSTFSARSR